MFVLWLGLIYVFGLWVCIRIGIWCRLAHISCTLPKLYSQGGWLGEVGLVWFVEGEVGLLETIPLG